MGVKLGLVVGFSMLMFGWLTSLLMVINMLPRNILVSLIVYAISIFGLILIVYGLTSILIMRRSVRKHANTLS